jgi:uncharacterized protein YndB with AHSA1/START domain
MQVSDMTKIERSTFIRAPRSRVWKAISDVSQFGAWFQVKAQGEFRPGATVHMISFHPCGSNAEFSVVVEQVIPETLLSWRWYPGAAPDANEPPTLVEFRLEDADGGTKVTVTESGFDRLSLAKRAAAFEDNSKGWTEQMVALERYVGHEA